MNKSAQTQQMIGLNLKHLSNESENAIVKPMPQPNTVSNMSNLEPVPSALQIEYYQKILDIRLQIGEEDEVAENIQKYLLSCNDVGKVDYMYLVTMLFNSYPVLKHRHLQVWESLVKLSVAACKRNFALFRECVQIVMQYILPRPAEQLEDGKNGEPDEDPIPTLDAIYTMQVWGTTMPFKLFYVTKKQLDSVLEELKRFDFCDYAEQADNCPAYAMLYYKDHSD